MTTCIKQINDFEQIIYTRVSTYVISAQRYKFDTPSSYKYYFTPDGKLAKVETNARLGLCEFSTVCAHLTELDLCDYDRENFSYLTIFTILCIHTLLLPFGFGFITLPASIIFCSRLIYWHHKKYHFPQNIHNEMESGLVKI
jgi:hypothetical protein